MQHLAEEVTDLQKLGQALLTSSIYANELQWITHGKNVKCFPPFFMPNNLASKQMIQQFSEEIVRKEIVGNTENAFVPGQMKNFNGLIAEQAVYLGLNYGLNAVFLCSTLFHNVEFGINPKLNWTALQQLCPNLQLVKQNAKNPMEIDFLIVTKLEDFNAVVMIPIEVKASTNPKLVVKSIDQVERYAEVIGQLFGGQQSICVLPTAILIPHEDDPWMDSNDTIYVCHRHLNSQLQDFEENGDFWKFIKNRLTQLTGQNRISTENMAELYNSIVAICIGLQGLSKYDPRNLDGTDVINSMSKNAIITFGELQYTLSMDKFSKKRSYSNLKQQLHSQVYLKTFDGFKFKKQMYKMNSFKNIKYLENGTIKQFASKFFEIVTKEQAEVLELDTLISRRVLISGCYGSGKTILLLIHAMKTIQYLVDGREPKCSGVIFVATADLIERTIKPAIADCFGARRELAVEYWSSLETSEAVENIPTNPKYRKQIEGKYFFIDEAADFNNHSANSNRFGFVKLLALVPSIQGIWFAGSHNQATLHSKGLAERESLDLSNRVLCSSRYFHVLERFELSQNLRSVALVTLLAEQENRVDFAIPTTAINVWENLYYGHVARFVRCGPSELDKFNAVAHEVMYYKEFLDPGDILVYLSANDLPELTNYLSAEHGIVCCTECSETARDKLNVALLSNGNEIIAGLEFAAIIAVNETFAISRAVFAVSCVRQSFGDIQDHPLVRCISLPNVPQPMQQELKNPRSTPYIPTDACINGDLDVSSQLLKIKLDWNFLIKVGQINTKTATVRSYEYGYFDVKICLNVVCGHGTRKTLTMSMVPYNIPQNESFLFQIESNTKQFFDVLILLRSSQKSGRHFNSHVNTFFTRYETDYLVINSIDRILFELSSDNASEQPGGDLIVGICVKRGCYWFVQENQTASFHGNANRDFLYFINNATIFDWCLLTSSRCFGNNHCIYVHCRLNVLGTAVVGLQFRVWQKQKDGQLREFYDVQIEFYREWDRKILLHVSVDNYEIVSNSESEYGWVDLCSMGYVEYLLNLGSFKWRMKIKQISRD